MKCIIRLDDITPDMNWDKFHKVERILDQYSVCPLIGIVPDNQDEKLQIEEKRTDFIEKIQGWQQKGWAIAQHGMYHVYETQDSGILGINPFSEFAGLSYEAQVEKLSKGKLVLEDLGVNIDIFMAPGHTYDKNTLRALKDTGFAVITDGLYKKPYTDKGLLFVPCRMTANFKVKGFDTICLHTNLMSDKECRQLEDFCKKHKEDIISFEPEEFAKIAVKRTFWVAAYEKAALFKRTIKDKAAHSEKLIWYMEWTNHKNSKIKWIKRIVCVPVLLFKR